MGIYDDLIGGAPTDKEKVAEVAAALRRRRSYGELGMLSGDKVLGKYGQGLVKEADDYASQLQDTRRHDIDDKQTKAYQDSQIEHMGSVLKETMRGRDMADATTRRGQDLSYLATQLRAAAAAKKAATTKAPKFTVSDRRDLQEGASLVANMRQLQEGFKPEFSGAKLAGVTVPGGRALMNTLSAAGLGSKDMDESQKWWSESERLYDLFNRNKLFGATLTTNEMKAWANANASKNMKAEQIGTFLKSVTDNAERELSSKMDFFKAGGYNEDQIGAITQRTQEARQLPGEEAAPEEDPEAMDLPTYEEYDTLPPGSQFTDPQGNVRQKP